MVTSEAARAAFFDPSKCQQMKTRNVDLPCLPIYCVSVRRCRLLSRAVVCDDSPSRWRRLDASESGLLRPRALGACVGGWLLALPAASLTPAFVRAGSFAAPPAVVLEVLGLVGALAVGCGCALRRTGGVGLWSNAPCAGRGPRCFWRWQRHAHTASDVTGAHFWSTKRHARTIISSFMRMADAAADINVTFSRLAACSCDASRALVSATCFERSWHTTDTHEPWTKSTVQVHGSHLV